MAKKNKAGRPAVPSEKTVKAAARGESPAPLSRPARILVWAGAASVVLGFLALTRVDALARNGFSVASPLLILGGYGLIACGLALPERGGGGEDSLSLPPAKP